jgi:TatD DNase family protein
MIIDTHAHIYSDQFDDDREAVIQRALDANVKKILMPNVDSESIEAMLQCEEAYPEVCEPMMGLHPCSVKEDFEEELAVVEEWLEARPFIAIGEIGIDLYWDQTFKDQQIEAFKRQLNWAKDYDIPVCIHSREATREVLDVLQSEKEDNLRGVFHCFSGSLEEAKEVISLGFLLGIGGVSTFKNGGLDLVLPEMDLKHIILETDCPYLAPVPHRGKRNEPAYTKLVLDRVSELTLTHKDEVRKITTENAVKLFDLIVG